MGDDAYGINRETLWRIVNEVKVVADLGVEIGDRHRRRQHLSRHGRRLDRHGPGDGRLHGHAGHGHERHGAWPMPCARPIIQARVQSALNIEQVVEPYIRGKAIRYLEEGKVVVFGGGTGNPFFTTDTAAALRGSEIGADIVLKATKVDGVYTADPKKDPTATRFTRISFDEAIGRNLDVMDATAFALCRDQKLPINVFSIFKAGALKRVVMGEDEGTLVHC